MKGKNVGGASLLGLLLLLASCGGTITESSEPALTSGSETPISSEVSSSIDETPIDSSVDTSTSSDAASVSEPDSEPSSIVTTYTITIDGTGFTATGPTEAEAGETITIEIEADDGHRVIGATLNGEDVEIVDGKITFTMPEENVTIEVETATIHNVIVEAPTGVTVTGTTTGIAGETIVLGVEAEEGYRITEVTLDGEPVEIVDGKITFTMPDGDATLIIEAAAIHNVIVEAPTGVTVTGTTSGIAGDKIVLTIDVTLEGYGIDTITVDGTPITMTGNTIEITMGDADVTVVITIKQTTVLPGEGGIVEEW